MNRRKFILRHGLLVPMVALAPQIAFPQVLLQGRKDVRFPPTSASVPSPSGWWKLNDASGTSAVDSSGNGFTGTLSGTAGPTWGTGPNGNGDVVFGTANTDQQIDCGSNALLKPTTTGSFCAWFKMAAAVTSFQTIMSNNSEAGSEANGCAIYPVSGKIKGSLNNGTTNHTLIAGSTTLVNGNWYHVVLCWDGAFINLYLNGASDATAVAQTFDPTPAHPFTIGRDGAHTASSNWRSEIDDVRVYGVALTSGQVATIFNGGAQ